MMKKKYNKYEKFTEPEATLDYHEKGILKEHEIMKLCENFLQKSIQSKKEHVLIITGKGTHSKAGPVILPLLLDYLETHPNVFRVVPARRDRGGSGALEVSLQMK